MSCNRDLNNWINGSWYGEGTYSCKSENVGEYIISAYFGGATLTNTTVHVQERTNGNGNMIIVALIGLAIAAVIISVLVIVAFVVWMRRRNKNKDMTKLKEEVVDEVGVGTAPLKETE